MSTVGIATSPAKPWALLQHARFVITENPITGVAFGLFVLLLLAAILGPLITPYDPLASDTAASLAPPSACLLYTSPSPRD